MRLYTWISVSSDWTEPNNGSYCNGVNIFPFLGLHPLVLTGAYLSNIVESITTKDELKRELNFPFLWVLFYYLLDYFLLLSVVHTQHQDNSGFTAEPLVFLWCLGLGFGLLRAYLCTEVCNYQRCIYFYNCTGHTNYFFCMLLHAI